MSEHHENEESMSAQRINHHVDDHLKVYVGNLSFNTNNEELAETFSQAGTVTKAIVVTRNGRHRGYGFVTFDSEDAVARAVEQFNQTLLSDRKIAVEAAKPASETKPRAPRPPRAPRAAPATNGEEGAVNGAAATGSSRRSRGRRAANAEGAAHGEEAANGEEGAPARTRPPRRSNYDPNAEQSTTTLFVANLPYSVDDEALSAVFTDRGYEVASAKVIVNRFTNRSKGFGFVEFANETEQKRALEALDGEMISERPIALKVAMVSQTPKAAEEAAPVEDQA